MSSLGGQWRVIRHYLSLNNLHAELDKLLQRLKPATPEQWDNVIRRFEKVVSARLAPGIDAAKTDTDAKVKATTIQETDTKALNNEQRDAKPKEAAAPSVGSELRELSIESLLQGLRLKKDIRQGKISEPMWKDQKHTVTKSSIHSRTAYVISAVVAAASRESVLARAETLVQHLHSYPEARDYAIKVALVLCMLMSADSTIPQPRAPNFQYFERPNYRYPYYDENGKGKLLYGYGGPELYQYKSYSPLEGIY